MTQEERQLLFKDLCARLPYKPYLEWDDNKVIELNPISYETIARIYFQSEGNIIRPYLRSMSSMTEEDFKKLHSICPHSTFNKTNVPGWIVGIDGSDYGRISRIDEISKLIDWFNAHHFDYRGLIEKGLALEAPEGMYNTKTE